jgi:hypothetical protein
MTYTTYENRHKYIATHESTCNQLKKNGGIHSDRREHYKEHKTLGEAHNYAEERGLREIKICGFSINKIK